METFRVTPSGNQESRRRIGSYAKDADEGWRCRTCESFKLGLQVVDLLTELLVAAGKGAKSVSCRRHGTVQTTGTEALAASDKGTCGETIKGLAKLGRGRDQPEPSSG